MSNSKEYHSNYYYKHKVHLLRLSWKKKGIDISIIPDRPESCEICGSTKKIVMDHCHKKKVFRGWLCHNCNLVLGHAKDDVKVLKKLIKYLEER